MNLLQQVKQLFGFCGQVKSCRMVGNNQFAFVEYSSQGVSSISQSESSGTLQNFVDATALALLTWTLCSDAAARPVGI